LQERGNSGGSGTGLDHLTPVSLERHLHAETKSAEYFLKLYLMRWRGKINFDDQQFERKREGKIAQLTHHRGVGGSSADDSESRAGLGDHFRDLVW
jgi:hypothetical protein